MKRFLAIAGLCLLAVNAQAQQRIEALPPQVVPVVENPLDSMRDFMRTEEARTCAELKSFARDTVLQDTDFIAAVQNRNTRKAAAAASKFAAILANTLDTDFVFYHPNTRFFVRVNDNGYRGRMRLSSEAADASSICYWERLPSQDVVYSVLMKLDGDKTGYLKMSKKLTRMVKNVPDALEQFGKVRVYTALDKTGLKKMAWFKMRRAEPDKTKFSGWCTAQNLAFLSSVGSGKPLAKKQQRKLLKKADGNETFALPELNLTGGMLALKGLDGERLGAVVYALGTAPDVKDSDDAAECENTENILYRFFE
ncbi:MAG TPA: hypothetical protein DD624_03990 [Alphaproteobacteria bacterium]|nr:hypothetical protein [Alphaproteobacteria bacterium]